MNTIIYLLIWFAVLGLFVYFITRPGFSNAIKQNKLLYNRLKSCKYKLKSPKGMPIRSAYRSLSAQMMSAIDEGFDEFTASLPRNGYLTQRLNRAEQTVYVIVPDRPTGGEMGVPDFKVKLPDNNPYIGTEYDNVDEATGEHFTYAAGLTLDASLDKSVNKFIICNVTSNFQNAIDAVRNELEHIFLYHKDRQRYHETESHLDGAGHPILP